MNHNLNSLLNRYLFMILALYVYNEVEINAQHSIVERSNYKSSVLGQNIGFSVILPDNYYRSAEKYPVVYLFHGVGGDGLSWINRCSFNTLIDSLSKQKLIANFIYIMPDAKNSYYIDNYDKSFCFESFFINEFIPYIDSAYRTKSSPQNRSIMGLSMGGFGSVVLAIKHSETFSTIVSLSGALRDSASFEKLQANQYNQYFNNVFGPQQPESTRITKHWKQNSPYFLIDSANLNSLKNINWYFDCGSEDFLYNDNENFHHLLMKYQIPHEFHSRQGKHNWEYWYISAAKGLMYNTYIINKNTFENIQK